MDGRLRCFLLASLCLQLSLGTELNPPKFNLAEGKKVVASATCGIDANGDPLKEQYCHLAGASLYNPHSSRLFIYEQSDRFAALSIAYDGDEHSFIQGGQNCDFCDASVPGMAHPVENLVDGTYLWWQSPPLSRGMQYREINITIDLEQEFHVAYVVIKMANSPRPAAWKLEKSVDYGKTYNPWWYFAESPAQCQELFGEDTLQLVDDDTAICTTEFSRIEPLENGEIHISLVNMRNPHSEKLQNWIRATNIRIQLLKPKTLDGHLMEFSYRDPSVLRRYFYAIKDIEVGGRCVCHGHADTCDVLEAARPKTLLCRCEHNTCGDQCERCCDGFKQKKWQPSTEQKIFRCEPCNCHGHSFECEYDEAVDKAGLSRDINGAMSGGGVCKNCQDNTEGNNCDRCAFGFYRTEGKELADPDVCQPCLGCDPYFHTGHCEELTGRCYCKDRFRGRDCEECAVGYYGFPTCSPCDCNFNGTDEGICLPVDGRCPCKPGFGGQFCNECVVGKFGFPDCIECECNHLGSVDGSCHQRSGQCVCRNNFWGLKCQECADGYFDAPNCQYCDCDPLGTEPGVCDKTSGICLCKEGFTGPRCDQCNSTYYGYPNCQRCNCNDVGSLSELCHPQTGQCQCNISFGGKLCDQCALGFYRYPDCKFCNCSRIGSRGVTCNFYGQCVCHPNFDGLDCGRCKENFYNFPVCEECNCDLAGVSTSFAGCGSVRAGELCECKPRVTGRICNRCLPTFWRLEYRNPQGCEECGCSETGTLARLNTCDQQEGSCPCKLFVTGNKCDTCKPGFFDIQTFDQYGCQPCNCDIGGTAKVREGKNCDTVTGQCVCKQGVTEQDCSVPAEGSYHPSLWQLKYEIEDGRTPGQYPVRFAVDETEFPGFTGKGFVVFSPIQNEIAIQHLDIPKSAVYRVLFRYVNPLNQDVPVNITIAPYDTDSGRHRTLNALVKLPPSATPKVVQLTQDAGKYLIFELESGRYTLTLAAEMRFFLDWVVLMPFHYYEAKVLKDTTDTPCKAVTYENSTCVDYHYPHMPFTHTLTPSMFVSTNGEREPIEPYSGIKLPLFFGPAAHLGSNVTFSADVKVAKPGKHLISFGYYSTEEKETPVKVRLTSGGVTTSGDLTFHYCPYSGFCRDIVSENGVPKVFDIVDTQSLLEIDPVAEVDLALRSIVPIPEDSWNVAYLLPVAKCLRKNGKCRPGAYLMATANSVALQAESPKTANHTMTGEELTIVVGDPNIKVVAAEQLKVNVDRIGKVNREDHYKFVVHFYQTAHVNVTADVLLVDVNTTVVPASDQQFNATPNAQVKFPFCPSVSGCRAIVELNYDPANSGFLVKENFFINISLISPGPVVYIDYVVAVPKREWKEDFLTELSPDNSGEFLARCGQDNFDIQADHPMELCRKAVFSITTDYNGRALECDCNFDGSTSLECQSFGGQCPCKPFVHRRQCSECLPGYYGFPNCQPCGCPAKQQCHPVSGQCFCPLHVVGQSCDSCDRYAYGFDPLIGCQECECNAEGSDGSLECDQERGQCRCKPNVGGRKCDTCLPGYHNFPFCDKCDCSVDGTTGEICDQNTAACLCKPNVDGLSCDQCKYGTFQLQASNSLGCTDCFCFGITTQCRSSTMPKSNIASMNLWTVVGSSSARLVGDPVSIELHFDADLDQSEGVFFSAPPVYLKNQIRSYGGRLRYEIAVTPASPNASVSAAHADVIIKGHNLTIEYYSEIQPSDPRETFNVQVDLLPEKWMTTDGSRLTRPQLMLVLRDLMAIHIKATYFSRISSAKLTNVQLSTAYEDPNALGEPDTFATNVEHCSCPAPYKGTSCEKCADGYYRVPTGPYLGSCVPCQCHKHADSCDQTSGKCLNCRDGTTGDHCERCAEGHYGDATKGTRHDCQLCACPHPMRSNNFAESCEVINYGNVVLCKCQTGYAGDRCEVCENGFFGEPLMPGNKCNLCDCSSNNNLTQPGSCDRLTGECGNCLRHTTGPKCEICADWYYGDAVEAKDCSECSCDRCGSSSCNSTTGDCNCKDRVSGSRCDRCEPDHWGFDTCDGCQRCDCASASLATQCDFETGQCPCSPGAGGMRCESCKEGFWDYSAAGCRKCDCESDLSLGTVCDVNTGNCHCMDGASGSRCDQCIKGFLRIPGHGCLFCDECVQVMVDDVDQMDKEIVAAQTQIGNVSFVYLTAKRLGVINATANRVLQEFDLITVDYVKPEDSAVELDNIRMKLSANVTDLKIRSDKLIEETNKLGEREKKLFDQMNEVELTVNETIAKAKVVVAQMNTLTEQLNNERTKRQVDDPTAAEPTQSPSELEAERLVQLMRLQNLAVISAKVQNELKAAEALWKEVKLQSEKSGTVRNYTMNMTDRLEMIISKIEELEMSVKEAVHTSRHAEKLLRNNGISVYKLGEETVRNSSATCKQTLMASQEMLNRTEVHLLSADEYYAALPRLVAEVNESLALIKSKIAAYREPIDEVRSQRPLVWAKANELESEAARLDSLFINTRDTSTNATKAAEAYQQIVESLKFATAAGQNASSVAKEAMVKTIGASDRATEARLRSNDLLRSATQSRSTVVNELTKGLEAAKLSVTATEGRLRDQEAQVQSITDTSETLQIRETLDRRQQLIAKGKELVKTSSDTTEQLDVIVTQLAALNDSVNNLTTSRSSEARAKKLSDVQIEELKSLIPRATERLAEAKSAMENSSAVMNDVELKIESLKTKVLQARDIANRIKMGARLNGNASITVKNPPRLIRSASHTDVSLIFNTNSSEGLLMFLGNEVGSYKTRLVPTDDYLALVIRSGRPQLLFNLGEEETRVQVDKFVSDNRWHKATVERTGKSASLWIETEGEPTVNETGSAKGLRSVLNLHQDNSRFFVGGFPPDAKVPTSLRTQGFVGVIDELNFHGTPVGLWNFGLNGRIGSEGAFGRTELIAKTESSVSFTGRGHETLKKGFWNPRIVSTILISVKTYASDGLIFFAGPTKNPRDKKDFMTLWLANGRVHFQYELGSGVGKCHSAVVINDGRWHKLNATRDGKEGILVVDEVDEERCQSPGGMMELNLPDVFHVGGVPDYVDTRGIPAKGLIGCVDNLRLEGIQLNLNKPIKSAEMANGCVSAPISIVSFDQTPAKVEFSGLKVKENLEISLKMKPTAPVGILFTLAGSQGTLAVALQGNDIIITVAKAGGDANTLEHKSKLNFMDGTWHYITVARVGSNLRIDIDDVDDKSYNDVFLGFPQFPASLHFGSLPADIEVILPVTAAFQGCLGDVSYNQAVLHFNEASRRDGNVNMVGCPLEEPIPTVPPVTEGTTEGGEFAEETGSTEPSAEESPTAATFIPPTIDRCPLPRTPLGPRDDSRGIRFGLTETSRVQYQSLPDVLDRRFNISLSFRATADNGILLYVASDKHDDFVALMLMKGKIHFGFNCGSGAADIQSKRSFMDGEWHEIVATREVKKGVLMVDGRLEAEGFSPGEAATVNVVPPLYFGGVPDNVHKAASRVNTFKGVGSGFGGCMADLKINDKVLSHSSYNDSVMACADYIEKGMFFAKEGGYAVVSNKLHIGSNFVFSMDLKPRVDTAVLLSIGSPTGGDFLSLQLFENSAYLRVDSGDGIRSVNVTLESNRSLCDGHWHKIKAVVSKNTLFLVVDRLSTTRAMKGKNTAIDTKDALYLGGVPPDRYNTKALLTTDPYVGCMRYIEMTTASSPKLNRKQKRFLKLSDLVTSGNVSKDVCPVN